MTTKAFLLMSVLLFLAIKSDAQSTNASTTKSSIANDAAFFNGAWKSDDNKIVTIFFNGYFNFIEKDFAGNWNIVHAGSYVINNDKTFSGKAEYTSHPEHFGMVNTADYEISGSNLKMKMFKKLITGRGVDISAQIPKQEWITLVRQTK